MSEMKKAIELLDSFTDLFKAESAGRTTLPSEVQARREYGHSFARYPRGVSGGPTPDLPERGRDWHGTVPGVPDEPQDEDQQAKDEEAFKDPENLLDNEQKQGPTEPVNLMAPTQEIQDKTTNTQQPPAPPIAAKSLNDMAIKSLAGAPRFSPGPIMPPKERKFLIEQGYDPEEVDSGAISMTPRLRAQYNKDLLSTVQKSITKLANKIELN
jgi:hypothetical protein